MGVSFNIVLKSLRVPCLTAPLIHYQYRRSFQWSRCMLFTCHATSLCPQPIYISVYEYLRNSKQRRATHKVTERLRRNGSRAGYDVLCEYRHSSVGNSDHDGRLTQRRNWERGWDPGSAETGDTEDDTY